MGRRGRGSFVPRRARPPDEEEQLAHSVPSSGSECGAHIPGLAHEAHHRLAACSSSEGQGDGACIRGEGNRAPRSTRECPLLTAREPLLGVLCLAPSAPSASPFLPQDPVSWVTQVRVLASKAVCVEIPDKDVHAASFPPVTGPALGGELPATAHALSGRSACLGQVTGCVS